MRVANIIKVLVRGGGDLASGAIVRLARVGFEVLVLELPQPLAVRRLVSFAQAVYDGSTNVEDIRARLADTSEKARQILAGGEVAVMVDPMGESAKWYQPDVILDARMMKSEVKDNPRGEVFLIGLGPGFRVAQNCDAVVETMRGPFLGRVLWEGTAEEDTGLPDWVGPMRSERVIRSSQDGFFHARARIGDHLFPGELIGQVGDLALDAPFEGILRGLIQDGLKVSKGLKIGDLDPRLDPRIYRMVSDKALAGGGGVLEAILSYPDLQKKIWK